MVPMLSHYYGVDPSVAAAGDVARMHDAEYVWCSRPSHLERTPAEAGRRSRAMHGRVRDSQWLQGIAHC
eukprot:3278596-Amphidinium_carterae.1